MVFVDSTGNGWPRCLEDKNAFNVITFQHLACNGIKNGRLNTEEGDSCGAGLGLDSTRERCDDDRPSLRLPVSVQHQRTSRNMYNLPEGIHNRALLLTDVFVVPIPRFWVDGLAHAAKDAQAAEVVVLNMVSAKASQKTNGGGRRVELSEFVLFNCLPIAGWGGVYGGGFEHRGSNSIGERAVHNISGYHISIASG